MSCDVVDSSAQSDQNLRKHLLMTQQSAEHQNLVIQKKNFRPSDQPNLKQEQFQLINMSFSQEGADVVNHSIEGTRQNPNPHMKQIKQDA